MSWNYRVCKYVYIDNGYTETLFEIREVHYNSKKEIIAVSTVPSSVFGESIEEVGEVLVKLNSALSKEIIDLDNIKYGKSDK